MTRRHYSNTSVPVALSSAITSSATSIPVGSTAGFPTPPFTASIERGTANEEVVLVTATPDGTHFTATRGYDTTTPRSHDTAKPFEHTVIAMDFDEANAHVNDTSLHVGAPTGVVSPFAGAEADVPDGWLICDGAAVSRTTYSELYALIGSTFGGGDGVSTFNVPDLRGRVVLGKDNMGGSSANRVTAAQADIVGSGSGAELVTLIANEMPTHTHTQNAHAHTSPPHAHAQVVTANPGTGSISGRQDYQGTDSPSFSPYFQGTNTQTTIAAIDGAAGTNQTSGGSAPHANMPPYITLNYVIKT